MENPEHAAGLQYITTCLQKARQLESTDKVHFISFGEHLDVLKKNQHTEASKKKTWKKLTSITMRPLKTQSAVSDTTLRCSWRQVVPFALWRMVECTSCRWFLVVRAAVNTLQCDPVSKRSI